MNGIVKMTKISPLNLDPTIYEKLIYSHFKLHKLSALNGICKTNFKAFRNE